MKGLVGRKEGIVYVLSCSCFLRIPSRLWEWLPWWRAMRKEGKYCSEDGSRLLTHL
jgi:hypothetical protein